MSASGSQWHGAARQGGSAQAHPATVAEYFFIAYRFDILKSTLHRPLDRLYRTKLAYMATVLLFVGLGLLILGHWVPQLPGWQWLVAWPIVDIGSALFTTGLLGVTWQYVDGEDREVRDTERLKRVLADSAPAMRDAVIRGFAFEPADLERVATDETLDRIITNGLGIRLGDVRFASEIYNDLCHQAIGLPERLHDARIAVRLSPSSDRSTAHETRSVFSVAVRWEFKLIPSSSTRRFVGMDDIQEFRELDQDRVATSAWYFKPKAGLKASDREAFELVDFTVTGSHAPSAEALKRAARPTASPSARTLSMLARP